MNYLDLSPLSRDIDNIAPQAPTAAITMSTAIKQQLTTFDEFCLLVNEDRKADLTDGVIYMASPENTDAQDAEVPEYWTGDEIEQKVTLLRLDPKGKYLEVRPRKGVLQSEVVPGFYLRAEWLWQNPLPVVLEIVGQLLAG